MVANFEIKLHGAKELHRRLKSLERKTAKKAVRSAVTAANRIQRKAVKESEPKDSGAMRKSITTRVKYYPSSGVFVGVVGPERGARYDVTSHLPSGAHITKEAIPERYAHLLEYGWRKVTGGTLGYWRSKAGYAKVFGLRYRRRTTRRSEEQKRHQGYSASRRKWWGVPTHKQTRRTGGGQIVGRQPAGLYLEKAGKRSRDRALQKFMSMLADSVARYWKPGT